MFVWSMFIVLCLRLNDKKSLYICLSVFCLFLSLSLASSYLSIYSSININVFTYAYVSLSELLLHEIETNFFLYCIIMQCYSVDSFPNINLCCFAEIMQALRFICCRMFENFQYSQYTTRT